MSIELIGTIAATIVILAIAAGVTARHGRLRPLVIGLGLAAIPVGLYLTGVLRLTINGINSLIDWFQRTVFTDAVAWGLGLFLGGIVVTVIGIVLPKKPPRERVQKAPEGRAVPPGKPAQPLPGAKPAGAKPAAAAPSKPTPAAKPQGKAEQGEFDEIEELLRKRGIM